MRYDELFERLTSRAIRQAAVDLDTLFEEALAMGMSPEALEERLIADLEMGGPVFGKFQRSLLGATEASVLQAERQGDYIGTVRARAEEDEALADLLALDDQDWDDMLDGADAAAMDDVEQRTAEVIELTWIAELRNTCQYCLPLHGSTHTAAEWAEMGLHPRTIHVSRGFNSECHCRFVEAGIIDRTDEIAPLKRVPAKTTTGLKVPRRTIRSVSQEDVIKSQRAVAEASQSLEGRRMLRIAGMAKRE